MRAVSVSRSTALVALSLLLLVLVFAGPRLARIGTVRSPQVAAAPLEPGGATASPPLGATPVTSVLVIHVVGAVRRPGLYRLGDGKRVADAVARAGGATRRADLAALNLAAPLVDGTQVLIPARANVACSSAASGSAVAGSVSPGQAATAGAGPKVSLSTATAEQLDALPGVGPVTAQKILDYRAEHGGFASVDDLDAVPGIGPTRIDELRDLVTP
jgi:competence protein ComEA